MTTIPEEEGGREGTGKGVRLGEEIDEECVDEGKATVCSLADADADSGLPRCVAFCNKNNHLDCMNTGQTEVKSSTSGKKS